MDGRKLRLVIPCHRSLEADMDDIRTKAWDLAGSMCLDGALATDLQFIGTKSWSELNQDWPDLGMPDSGSNVDMYCFEAVVKEPSQFL